MADAAQAVLTRDSRECTDLSGYGGEDLVTDFFLDG